MKILRFACEDHYEAEKLASMTSVRDDGSIFIEAVMSIIGKEVILRLKDKSCHSVTMGDLESLERLRMTLADLALGRWTVVSSRSLAEVLELTLNESRTL